MQSLSLRPAIRFFPGASPRLRRNLATSAAMGSVNGSANAEVATFALGCKKMKGVLRTAVGYTGGTRPNPTYESVCRGDGHTEALRIWFDPSVITYEQLLESFFEQHDPTRGSKPQYKSALWYHNEGQLEAIRSMITHLEQKYGRRIATTIDPAVPWTDAEEYHQDYLGKAVTSRWGW